MFLLDPQSGVAPAPPDSALCPPPAGRTPVILYPIGALNAGGAQMRSLQLIREVKLRRPDVRVIIYDFSGRSGYLDEAFRAAGCEIVKGLHEPRETIRFLRYCRQVRPDLVHTNLGVLSGYLLLAAFLAGVRIRICHFRNTIDRHTGWFDRYAKRGPARVLIWLLATKAVGVCHSARSFSPVPRRRWLPIYNGIPHEPLEVELRLAGERVPGAGRVVALGRIHPQKQYWRFAPIFDALRRLPGQEEARLDIFGTGDPADLDRLEQSVSASAFSESIAVHGHSPEPVGRLRAGDVLLLTSAFEGLPGTVIEALSAGTPVVSADLPGVREVAACMPGVTIVPDGSSDEGWALALAGAMRANQREAIIRAFRASPFLLERYVTDMMALWGLQYPPETGSEIVPLEMRDKAAA